MECKSAGFSTWSETA